MKKVALLTEGVDRNIEHMNILSPTQRVALLTEGVDRNFTRVVKRVKNVRRPPHGGRG